MTLTATTATIGAALATGQMQGLSRLETQLLLLHALDIPAQEHPARRAWLLAHDGDPLAPDIANRYSALVNRRGSGEPMAYILGRQEFFGLDLLVDTRVLVPRPDTETLVRWALDVCPTDAPGESSSAIRVLDLGTGSGAIALALKHQRAAWQVDAVDASADALQVANENARRLRLDIRLIRGHWLDAVTGSYDTIVSNPPYIASGDPHLTALVDEPIEALVAGPDGLADIRQIIDAARPRLRPGGWLLLEHGFDQAAAVCELLVHAGYQEIQSRQDFAGHWRCSGGRQPAGRQGLDDPTGNDTAGR